MTPLTLEEASAAALEAARAGDLKALAVALAARAEALARGETVTPGVHAAGELTAQLLRELIRNIALEDARLRQLAALCAPNESGSGVDFAG